LERRLLGGHEPLELVGVLLFQLSSNFRARV
jgi:hypothetical protein